MRVWLGPGITFAQLGIFGSNGQIEFGALCPYGLPEKTPAGHRRAAHLSQRPRAEGVNMVDFRTTTQNLSPAINELDAAMLKDQLAAMPVPLVVDHFGGARGELGPQQPSFAALVDLVRSGKAYVKVSGAYRSSSRGPDFSDVAPLARTLIEANSSRPTRTTSSGAPTGRTRTPPAAGRPRRSRRRSTSTTGCCSTSSRPERRTRWCAARSWWTIRHGSTVSAERPALTGTRPQAGLRGPTER